MGHRVTTSEVIDRLEYLTKKLFNQRIAAMQRQRDLMWYVPTMRDHNMTDLYELLPLVLSATQCSLLCACMCICMYVSMHRNVCIHVEVTGQSWLSSLSSNYLLKKIYCICNCVCVRTLARASAACTHECRCLQRPEEAITSPEAGVTGSFKPPDVNTQKQAWVFCNSNTCF